MRVLPIHAIPIFLSRALPGELGSQLRVFDVFYKTAPVVGWHIIGADDVSCEVVGFSVDGGPLSEGITAWDVREDSPQESVTGFYAEGCDCPEGTVMFHVEHENDEQNGVVGFTSVKEDEEKPEGVVGFIVGDDE